MTEKAYNPSICESCGEQFGCGANLDGCWCNDIKLADNAAKTLKEKFDTCLCPKCLENYTALPSMKITYPDGSVEILVDAVRVDSQNYHEGMYDFYDKDGNLLKQISMHRDVHWEAANEIG